ncbi:tripartite tricarboxylate transporter TctB family protein [Pelagibius marinus]|uniref:tripartite tricarboxylate transporter TctB family protein n=1 Tax=Pelagibius marinus TaxID=2762760 RepID=UPI00187261E5|nr:tripartite tricarboxylate transporter TctB family protein [Pelagibius marinus]
MQSGSSRRPGELVFAVVLLAFSLAAFWQAYEISGFSGLTTAGVFPMLASGTMVLAALVILMRTAGRRGSEGGAAALLGRFLREVTPLRHAAMLALILVYLVAMPWLGFTASSGCFLFVSFAYLWRRSFLVSLLLTAVSLGAIYVIFRVVFQVVLPQGSLLQGVF